jgi:organic hydroperoxide reductase OsmC/OhrA
MATKADVLHEKVHAICFIARSVNFPVRLRPVTRVGS